MAARNPRVRSLAAKKAITKRHYGPDADTTDIDRELQDTRAEAFIAEWLADAPKPTPEQIDRLRALLPAVRRRNAGA